MPVNIINGEGSAFNIDLQELIKVPGEMTVVSVNELHLEKPCLQGFCQGLTQTRLYNHRRWLEASNF